MSKMKTSRAELDQFFEQLYRNLVLGLKVCYGFHKKMNDEMK